MLVKVIAIWHYEMICVYIIYIYINICVFVCLCVCLCMHHNLCAYWGYIWMSRDVVQCNIALRFREPAAPILAGWHFRHFFFSILSNSHEPHISPTSFLTQTLNHSRRMRNLWRYVSGKAHCCILSEVIGGIARRIKPATKTCWGG